MSRPLTAFNQQTSAKDGLQPYCKLCVREYGRDYNRRHPDKLKERKRRYRAKANTRAKERAYREEYQQRPEVIARRRESARRRREQQAGRVKSSSCEACGYSPDPTSEARKEKILYYDHNHVTGEFRGWLCHWCNLALGYTKDNVETLKQLIAYLETHSVEPGTKGSPEYCQRMQEERDG